MATSDPFDLAVALHRSGDFVGGEAGYRGVLARAPAHVGAHDMLAVLLVQTGRYGDAIAVFEAGLRLAPGRAGPLSNLGIAYQHCGRLAEALAAFDAAVVADPGHARAWCNRGDVLFLLDRPEEALAACERALELAPNLAEAHCNRANALLELRRLDEALQGFDTAIRLKPDAAILYNNRGNVLKDLQRFDAALADFDTALALAPGYADAHVNRGIVLREMGRLDDALVQYRAALALDPAHAAAHWQIGLVDLMQGRFADGWRGYEWRWRCLPRMRFVRHFDVPAWDGSPVPDARVLVYAEQGLGDTVQFARYLSAVAGRVASLIVEAQSPLLPLLESLNVPMTLVAAGDPLPAFDFHAAMMGLPYLLGGDIPAAPYLSLDPGRAQKWAARLGAKTQPRIGLAWSGNPLHANDARRSMPVAALEPLLRLPFEFHMVHKTAGASLPVGIRTHGDALADFADTAALIAAMDLTISVDTVIVHVAGALGLPAWVLLPHVADWRWLVGCDDSPWYASARLFRQQARGDWDGVVRAVSAAVCERFAPARTLG